jgi:hypothetical protein
VGVIVEESVPSMRLLPAPLGPRTPTKVSGWMEKLMFSMSFRPSRSMAMLPKRMAMPLPSRAGSRAVPVKR